MLPSQKLSGRVTQLNPAADPQSRQFTPRVSLPNPGGRLRPGLFVRVTLETERARQALVVPKEAGKRDREQAASDPSAGTVTLVSADNKAQVRPVRTGRSDANVFVLEDVREGGKGVVLSGRDIKEGGQPIKVAALTRVPFSGVVGEGRFALNCYSCASC